TLPSPGKNHSTARGHPRATPNKSESSPMNRTCPEPRRDLVGIFVAVAALSVLFLPHITRSPGVWSILSVACVLLSLGLFALPVGKDGGRLRRSERRFQRLLEAAPDAVVITDRAGAIVFVNWQTERLFGHRREELMGNTLEVLVTRPAAEG